MKCAVDEMLEPRLFLAAQAYDWKSAAMKGDGFIDGIVYSPAAPNVVYIHTDMGGAYRLDTSTNRWVPLNDWSQWNDWAPQNLGVETMAVDPTDPNRVYMSAGTYFSPAAILRSTDQGRTWQRTDVSGIHPNGNGNGRNGGERMVVDPNLPGTLYYGTRRDGLWTSTNSGATWSRINSFPVTGDASGTAQDVGLEWVLVDKSSASAGNASQTIYVGVSTTAASKIYVSNDGGATWNTMAGQPTTSAWFPIRAALAPDGNSLYLTYSNNVGPNGATAGNLYKVTSPRTSPSWTTMTTPTLAGGGGWSGVVLDPQNPSTIVISTLDWWAGPDDIFRSTNGGASWTQLHINNNRNDSSAAYASSLTPHWLGDVQINPFNSAEAIVTTGYGLYRTTNLTGGTPSWSFFNDGFEQSAVLEINSPNTGSVHLVDAIGDRDGFRHDNLDQSPSIGRLGQANGIAVGTSDDIDSALVDANYMVRLVRTSPWVQYSTDNGQHWSWMSSTGTSGSTSGGGNLAISADGTKVVYEPGGTGRVRFSTRSGSTWSSWTSTGITNQPANGAKIIADLGVGATTTFYAYVGTTVSRTTDGGLTWTVMTSAAPSGFNWIRAVTGQAGHLVAQINNAGLYRSTDGGATWAQINTVSIANQVGVGAGPTAGAYPSIYIGGTVGGVPGFFRSDDQGATWTMISDLAHQYGYVTVIQGDPRVYGRLYVGANGRGVQYGDIHTTPPSFPMTWNTQDIGNPGSVGSAGGFGSFEVIGGGAGIGGTSDQFRYFYTTLAGDGVVTARVVSNPSASPANNNAKAGVMVRNTLAANSAQTFMGMTPGSVNGAVFQTRSTASGSTATVNNTGLFGPYWVRLTRSGNTFTAERSADGTNWTQVGSPQAIAMGASVYVGLAVTASDNNFLNLATFDNVSVVPSTIAITGTNNPDTIRLVRNGALTEAWVNGLLQQTFDPATAPPVTISALDSDDAITLDFSAGNPLPASSLTIDGGAGADTLAVVGSTGADVATFDSSSFTMNGSTATHSSIATVTFDGAGGADVVTVNANASLTFPTTQHLSSLSIAGSLISAPNGSSGLGIRTSNLSITGSGTLDLTNNDLILDYAGASQLGAVESSIGSRLISSTPISLTTLGAMEASEYRALWGQNAPFDNEPVAGSAVLVKFTWNGDANFSGTVSFDDYVRIDIGFPTSLTGWVNGDFNRSGRTDFDDYVLIDLAFNGQSGVL